MASPTIRSSRYPGTTGAALAFLHLLLSAGVAWTWTLPSSTSLSSCRPHCKNQHQRRSLTTSPLLATSTIDSSRDIATFLEGVDESSLPLLRVGERVGSGSYGTVHQGFLIRAKDDIQPCIAKRAWALAELEGNVPSQILKLERAEKKRAEQLAVAQSTGLASVKLAQNEVENATNNDDDYASLSQPELKTRSERCRHYWEVERHCFQKIEASKRKIGQDSSHVGKATPAFLGVYQGDGSGDELEKSDFIQGYGLLGKESTDNGWFTSNGNGGVDTDKGHDWMVFEFVGSDPSGVAGEPARTLLDAMEVSTADQ